MKLKDILELMTEDSSVEIEYYPTPNLKATIRIDLGDDHNAIEEAIARYGECAVLWIQPEDYRLTVRI